MLAQPGNNSPADTAIGDFTLTDAIKYALGNQPALKQAYIDESIAYRNRNIALSGWMPQVNGAANLQHNFQLPTLFSNINGVLTPVTSGVSNTSIPQITATQNIFTPDLFIANKSAKLGIKFSAEQIINTKINLVASVSKAYYDVLSSLEQINVYKEDTARLRKNLEDAHNRYLSGVSDKVDYKQATISLNNSMSQLKTASETVGARYATLKMLMGYPAERELRLRLDTAAMLRDIVLDTTGQLRIEKRIEYQQLQTTRQMQRETTLYYKLSALPSISGFYSYADEFENNKFSDLYDRAYPYSYIGVQLNLPIFNGFRRTENVKKSKLQEERIDWDEVSLKLNIYVQYSQALAAYKSNLYYLNTQHENVDMAREVYDIVKLQYREGIKPYLDVIVAESDLQTSEINYQNALFQLLKSKIDLEQAMGDLPVE